MNSNFKFEDIKLSKIPDKIELVEHEDAWKDLIQLKMEPNDVVVTSFPKTGTTLTLQICHLLRGGDMSFQDQMQVSPFLEILWNQGLDEMHHKFSQKVYKTHIPLSMLATIYGEVKYVALMREPLAALKSFFNFENIKCEGGENSSFEDFAMQITKDKVFGATYWEQAIEYYQCRNCPNVLLLFYEDFIENPANYISRIAEFMGAKDYDLEKVKEQSSRKFMLEHVEKFNESFIIKTMKSRNRESSVIKNPGPRVTDSQHQKETTVSESLKLYLEDMWNNTITNQLGFKTYEEFKNAVNSNIKDKKKV